MMFPKPQRAERGTAAARRHMARVAEMPCVICGAQPVQVHHVIHGRYSQRRAGDFETIPLCPMHHDWLHHSPNEWKRLFGEDRSYLRRVLEAAEESA